MHNSFINDQPILYPMGSDANNDDNLESNLLSGSARVSSDPIHDETNFCSQLKDRVPEFPYEFDGVPEDRLMPESGCLDFYMERIGTAPDDGTKILHFYTSAEPSTISMPGLADIAAEKFSGITPPLEKYLCLRFNQKSKE